MGLLEKISDRFETKKEKNVSSIGDGLFETPPKKQNERSQKTKTADEKELVFGMRFCERCDTWHKPGWCVTFHWPDSSSSEGEYDGGRAWMESLARDAETIDVKNLHGRVCSGHEESLGADSQVRSDG